MKEDIIYKPLEEKIYPRSSSENKEEKQLGNLLTAFCGFVVGGLWTLLIVGFFGGERIEVYDRDVGDIVVRFFLDEKVYLIVIGSWLLFGLIIFLHRKNKK